MNELNKFSFPSCSFAESDPHVTALLTVN